MDPPHTRTHGADYAVRRILKQTVRMTGRYAPDQKSVIFLLTPVRQTLLLLMLVKRHHELFYMTAEAAVREEGTRFRRRIAAPERAGAAVETRPVCGARRLN